MNPRLRGTKVGAWYELADIPSNDSVVIKMRLFQEDEKPEFMFGEFFSDILDQRRLEADEFYQSVFQDRLDDDEEKTIARQACAGLLWSKQFYHYIVRDWLGGDKWAAA